MSSIRDSTFVLCKYIPLLWISLLLSWCYSELTILGCKFTHSLFHRELICSGMWNNIHQQKESCFSQNSYTKVAECMSVKD